MAESAILAVPQAATAGVIARFSKRADGRKGVLRLQGGTYDLPPGSPPPLSISLLAASLISFGPYRLESHHSRSKAGRVPGKALTLLEGGRALLARRRRWNDGPWMRRASPSGLPGPHGLYPRPFLGPCWGGCAPDRSRSSPPRQFSDRFPLPIDMIAKRLGLRRTAPTAGQAAADARRRHALPAPRPTGALCSAYGASWGALTPQAVREPYRGR